MNAAIMRQSLLLRLLLGLIALGLIGAKVNCAQSAPPNFVIILTDDQDVALNGMVPMEITQRLLANEGCTFTNAFTSSPICCPSRATLLTGQYAHNHRTHNNSVSGGCYAAHWRTGDGGGESRALPVHFRRRGYRTFYAGKYLNQYRGSAVPVGWSQWLGLNGNSHYYNYTLTDTTGARRRYTDAYLTDVLAERTIEFLSQQTVGGPPFLAVVAPPSAHAPFTPAPRHRGRFADVELLRTPNFNRPSEVLDKHWLLAAQQPARLSEAAVGRLRRINIRRWRTLLAVDEMVAAIVGRLEERRLLANTYVLYTSDNGFHLGQFGQAADKRQPYETDIRVPLVVRGPGVAAKSMAAGAVALVDVLPTLLELAGIEAPADLDGRSFAGQMVVARSDRSDGRASEPAERSILVQHWGEGNAGTFEPRCAFERSANLAGCDARFDCHCQDARNNTYVCMRKLGAADDLLYCEFDDAEQFAEAYDLRSDPYQLRNVAFGMLPSLRNQYSMALAKLAACAGASCRQVVVNG